MTPALPPPLAGLGGPAETLPVVVRGTALAARDVRARVGAAAAAARAPKEEGRGSGGEGGGRRDARRESQRAARGFRKETMPERIEGLRFVHTHVHIDIISATLRWRRMHGLPQMTLNTHAAPPASRGAQDEDELVLPQQVEAARGRGGHGSQQRGGSARIRGHPRRVAIGRDHSRRGATRERAAAGEVCRRCEEVGIRRHAVAALAHTPHAQPRRGERRLECSHALVERR